MLLNIAFNEKKRSFFMKHRQKFVIRIGEDLIMTNLLIFMGVNALKNVRNN